jgi:hypothetical protein
LYHAAIDFLMSPGNLDRDSLDLLVVSFPIFVITRWDNERMGKKSDVVRSNQLDFTTEDCKCFVATCEEPTLTLSNPGEFSLRSGVTSTGFLREPGACCSQINILIVVATAKKIFSFWQSLQ